MIKINYLLIKIFLILYVTKLNLLYSGIEKLVIIGGGPAGLSAALYAVRAQLDPLIIEEEITGSQLAKASYIENYPGKEPILGADLLNDLKKYPKELGARFLTGKVVDVNFQKKPFSIKLEDGFEILTNAIIIATGAKPRKLGCPGEEKYLAKGIAVCAKCDGVLFKNKSVIVIGGNHTALREVDILTKFAKKIIIINRKPNITGLWQLANKIIANPNIKILNNSTALEIVGDENWIKGVKILNKDNKEEIIKADGIFIAIGWNPASELFKNQLELDSKNRIKINNDSNTSIEGVFAAGDVTTKARHQVPVATNFGYIAAMDVEEYLKKNK